ncbi:MAG TPA: hypothetical protein VIF09_01990 [Polyangiaceae bacterium]|jgi:hypothetical protein
MKRAPPVLVALVVAVVGAGVAGSPPAAAADTKQECLASSDQGQSLRDDGKYQRAREAFASCAKDACPSIVRRDCMKWLADLEQQWPSVVVGAKDERGADLVDATLKIDGVPVGSRLDGKPLPVDPGVHTFHVEAAGYPPVEQHVVVRAGEKSRLIAVTLAKPAPPVTAAAAAAPVSAPPDTHGPTPQATRTSAWVFGGLAIVAFGTDAYFGLSGLSDRSHLKSDPCARTASCSQSSVDSIKTKFTVADIALGVGVASAAISAYLFIAGPKQAPAETTTALDVTPLPGGAAMRVGGSF